MSWERDGGVWVRRAEPGAPVLVLLDAQNLFDPATSTDGATWEVDAAVDALGSPLSVIGVPNAGLLRAQEYAGSGLDAFVDRVAGLAGAGPAGIGGSSLGAYASLYAAAVRPDVFTRVVAMSPAVILRRQRLFDALAARQVPEQRVWLDVGGREHEDPAFREEYLLGYEELKEALVAGGRQVGGYVDAEAIHHESAWARRLPEALRFLYG